MKAGTTISAEEDEELVHELSNPLTIILGCCYVALETLPAGHPAAARLRSIRRAALRCRNVVRRMGGRGGRA